ncbi:hypothetical protein IC801_13125 [Geobacillus sp. 44B]|nr:hypothetical protein IC801_13125 [Geobacillus sp. 44B]
MKSYSHVQVMSRDGFTGFRQGITNANPSILHVYDRWHFTGNAKKRLDLLLLSIVPSVMTWSEPNPSVREIEMTKAEKRKKAASGTKMGTHSRNPNRSFIRKKHFQARKGI